MTDIKTQDRQTLEGALLAKGLAVEPLYTCPSCGHERPAFALVDVSDISRIADDVACAECLVTALRDDAMDAEQQALVDESWEGETGRALKAQRNILLDQWGWTVSAHSPLSAECQGKWAEWLGSLHRMTLSVKAPNDWDWPIQPKHIYKDN